MISFPLFHRKSCLLEEGSWASNFCRLKNKTTRFKDGPYLRPCIISRPQRSRQLTRNSMSNFLSIEIRSWCPSITMAKNWLLIARACFWNVHVAHSTKSLQINIFFSYIPATGKHSSCNSRLPLRGWLHNEFALWHVLSYFASLRRHKVTFLFLLLVFGLRTSLSLNLVNCLKPLSRTISVPHVHSLSQKVLQKLTQVDRLLEGINRF